MNDACVSRPARFRPILLTVLGLTLLVLVWAGLEVYYAYSAKPAEQFDYSDDLRELAEDWQAGGGENVWPLLVDVIATHDGLLAAFRDEDTGWTWNSAAMQYEAIGDYDSCVEYINEGHYASEYSYDEAIRLLELHRQWAFEAVKSFDENGILDNLDAIALSRHALLDVSSSSDVDAIMVDDILEVGGKCRSFARALHATMRWSGSRGDWRKYAESMEHCLAIGRVLMMQPSVLGYLVGTAIRSLAIDQLINDVVDGNIPPSEIASIRAAYLRQADVPPFRYSLEADRHTTLDMLQRVHTESGRFIPAEFEVAFDQNIFAPATRPHWIVNLKSGVFPKWESTRRRVNNLFDRKIALIEMTRWKRLQQPDCAPITMMDFVAPAESLDGVLVKAANVWIYGNMKDQHKATEHGVALLLAIEVFAYETGSYPESLDDLVPDYFATLPMDPYAEEGKPWRYSLKLGARRGERPYVLYSLGIDCVDDGGSLPQNEGPKWALNPVMMTGQIPSGDYVITTKRPQY